MNRSTKLILTAGLTFVLASTMLTGCKKPPPPPPPKPVAPPPPPPPDPVTLDPIIAEAKPDARVQFPQERAPVDPTLAKAVIAFADGFAKADSSKVGATMDPLTKQVLEQLSSSGAFEEEMKKAEAIRVVLLSETAIEETNATGAQLVLAIQDPGSSYVLGWNIAKVNDAWVFSAMPTTGNTRARASEWDGSDISAFAAGGGGASAPSAAPAADESTGVPAAPDEPKKEEAPSDGGKTVRTPNGPIKVPGGG